MINELFELTEKFCSVHAAPGREEKLAAIVYDMAKPYCDEIRVDKLGSVVCKIGGCGEKKQKVVYSAHLDEVAFMVIAIDGDGYIHFVENGGPSTVSGAYREVILESGVHGVLVPPASGSFKSTDMIIDIGAKDKADAEKYAKVGDDIYVPSAIFKTTGGVISGRPLDNRVGMAVTYLAMKKLFESGEKPYNDMYFAFTVQEEIALPSVGAALVGREIDPDISIAVDMGDACDTPGRYMSECALGAGAAIMLRDITMVCDRRLADRMTELADAKGIKSVQYVSRQGGCDALPMQRFYGARAGFLSIPFRYLHTSAETCDLNDAAECVKLIIETANADLT